MSSLKNKKKEEKEKNLAERIIKKAKKGHKKFLEEYQKEETTIQKIQTIKPKKGLRLIDI